VLKWGLASAGIFQNGCARIVVFCREKLPLNGAIVTEGRPEEWLNDVEAAMFAACKSTLYNVLEGAKATKKEKWVKENQGQCIITAGQILWTLDCEKVLSDPDTAKKGMRQLKKKWVSYLNKLTAITRSKLSKIERNKTVALITIEVHARDVIDKLARAGSTAVTDFEWVSQLRFYWERESNDCIVRQVLSLFKYGYEYQVCSNPFLC
jgi:dynein heavy chain, axonemal